MTSWCGKSLGTHGTQSVSNTYVPRNAVGRQPVQHLSKAARDYVQNWSSSHPTGVWVSSRSDATCCLASVVDVEVDKGPERERVSDIQFTDERRPKSNLLLSFTVPASRCARTWEKAIKHCGKGLDVPGFRPGKKIPENVVLQEVGKQQVIRETVSRIMDSCFSLITEKYKEQAFAESIQILTEEDLMTTFSKDKDFKFQASIDLYPTVKWTGDYKKLKIQVPGTGTEETDQEECREKIWAALKQKGKLRLANRGLEKGDVAIIDFSARRADTGEAITGSEKKGMQVDTIDDNAILGIQGLVDALNGKVPGDTVQGVYDVHDSWWEQEGNVSSVDCKLEVKEVLTWDVPELSDELAKELLPGCEGVDDLWAKMIEAQRQIRKADLAGNVTNALVEAVAGIVDIEVPQFMIMDMAEKQYQQKLLEYQSSGRLSPEAIEQLATEEMMIQFMESQYDELELMQKGILGFSAIFDQQGMTVSEEEMKRELEMVIAEAKAANQELDQDLLTEQIHETLKAQKTIDFLTDVSEIEIITPDGPAELEAAMSSD